MDFTLAFICVVLVLIFGVDLYLLVAKGYKETISARLLGMGRDYPIIPFLIGIVMGHLFWPNLGIVKDAEEKCMERTHERSDG